MAEQLGEELRLAGELVEEQLSSVSPMLRRDDCVVAVGAGDSFAAALAAAGAAGAVALDPFELARSGAARALAARGCVLLALSVGGRTRAVVEAARVYRESGGRVVALTASRDSPLARVSGEVVELVYGGLASGVGAARHLVMLAALAGLWGARPRLEPLGVECLGLLGSEAHVGCLEAAGSALYTVLKLYEVYGSQVRFHLLEQFLHAPVYSVHSVTMYEGSGCGDRVGDAEAALRRAGVRVQRVPSLSDAWSNALSQAHLILECLWSRARMDGVAEPAYRRHRGLEAFTRLIYG